MGKYNFDTMVGEILDTPELKAIFEEVCPEVLEHPLLEAGRGFTFSQALSYIEDMIDEEQLKKIEEKMKSL